MSLQRKDSATGVVRETKALGKPRSLKDANKGPDSRVMAVNCNGSGARRVPPALPTAQAPRLGCPPYQAQLYVSVADHSLIGPAPAQVDITRIPGCIRRANASHAYTLCFTRLAQSGA